MVNNNNINLKNNNMISRIMNINFEDKITIIFTINDRDKVYIDWSFNDSLNDLFIKILEKI